MGTVRIYFFIPSRRRFQRAVAKFTDTVTRIFAVYNYIILGSESLCFILHLKVIIHLKIKMSPFTDSKLLIIKNADSKFIFLSKGLITVTVIE